MVTGTSQVPAQLIRDNYARWGTINSAAGIKATNYAARNRLLLQLWTRRQCAPPAGRAAALTCLIAAKAKIPVAAQLQRVADTLQVVAITRQNNSNQGMA